VKAQNSFDGIRADGSPAAYSFETNYDGKDCAVTGAGMPGGADTIALKRINSHKVEATLKRGGKEIGKSESEVSKGLSPNDSPLLLRDTAAQEIYALDAELP